jgi:hypothetical protein
MAVKADKKPDWFKAGEGFVDITLSRPADVGGAKVSQVRMREPMVRDQQAMAKMDGDNVDKEINFFANLCGLIPDDISALPMRDYSRLQAAYNSFID